MHRKAQREMQLQLEGYRRTALFPSVNKGLVQFVHLFFSLPSVSLSRAFIQHNWAPAAVAGAVHAEEEDSPCCPQGDSGQVDRTTAMFCYSAMGWVQRDTNKRQQGPEERLEPREQGKGPPEGSFSRLSKTQTQRGVGRCEPGGWVARS